MIVYDDLAPLEKIRVFDTRVERPPHYDTFGEFQYAYHYGDMYAPYIKQEEPLKTECQHFLDCIRTGATPVSCGIRGTELVRILEASTASLQQGGAPIGFCEPSGNGRSHPAAAIARSGHIPTAKLLPNGLVTGKKSPARPARKAQIKIVLNGNGANGNAH
jgi:hypothetical protein